MYRKEINAQSPLRILEQSIHGGLGKGNLGVVMARAGVGKTACLVQIGLDDLMRDRHVLHVSLEQTLDHVHSWYDALFEDLAARTRLENKEAVRASIGRHRLIKTYADNSFTLERFEEAVGVFTEQLGFRPEALLIDGFDWEAEGVAKTAAALQTFKALAKRLGAELWMTAQTHREITGQHPTGLTAPCDSFESLIDVAMFLEPQGHDVTLRLLKDHDEKVVSDTHLHLHPDTMRLVTDDEERRSPTLPPSAYTLLSGGAKGAEQEFGECAERWGLHEINFSFSGRGLGRTRGVVNLSDAELHQGEVSEAYLTAHMHRTYPQTPLFRKVLQSIWHQVSTARQVFVVGTILPDKTVKGGTGWAAELGKHWGKPVHVFDQERHGWFTWKDGDWVTEPEPRLGARRFTGTGTRFLTDEGRAAIRGLFERTFGKK